MDAESVRTELVVLKKHLVPFTAVTTLAVPRLALADTAVGVSDFQGILTAIEAQISVSTVVGVLTAGATAAIGLVFMWWGARKLAQVIMSAFRSGKIRF